MSKFLSQFYPKFLIQIFHKLPLPLKHWVSKVVYKPKIGKGVFLYGWSVFSRNVSIGDYSFMKQNVFMSNVSIGKFCCIADGLTVGLNEHPFREFSSYRMNGITSPFYNKVQHGGGVFVPPPTIVGNDVWIGQDVVIKGGVKIGNGAVIGARSVVTKDIPPYAVAAGAPAKVIKYRFEQEKMDLLQKLQWWNWDTEKIYQNLDRLRSFDMSLLEEN